MELLQMELPNKPQSGSVIFGTAIPPISRLRSMSDGEFEDIVLEWAHGYLKEVYSDVRRIGGAGDKGRDIICYYKDRDIDIYQCKHYANALSLSKYWIEFGKLCYYTYKSEYRIPKRYFIVASSGIGQALNNLVDNPHKIGDGLIENWNTHCKSKITATCEIELTGELEEYIRRFDFSIVNYLSEMTLLEQYRTTPWFKYRFGGGLIKKPNFQMPITNISEEEKKLEYVKQLTEAYKEYTNGRVESLEGLKGDNKLYDHFSRQRVCYHFAQILKRFSRDELLDESIYGDIKNQVYNSVVDISLEEYENSYKRLTKTLKEARRIALASDELGNIQPDSRCGMCHELVNDNKLSWVVRNEEC
jgi:hypothetical protein